MVRSYLLEVGSDEIPARFLPLAIRDLAAKSEDALIQARLSYESLSTYGTPRRLTLMVHGLSAMSRGLAAKVRGPSKKIAYDEAGSPTKALLGFAKSLGISPSEVAFEGSPGAEYAYGERRDIGRPAEDLLSEIVPNLVMGLELPHPMRWGEGGWRWYRPIRWVVSLYGEEIVPMSIAGIDAGRRTRGHRTLFPGILEIPSASAYFEIMDKAKVVVSCSDRERMILEGARDAASELGGEPLVDPELLSEVSCLCERPAAFLGRFDSRYKDLPEEVLVTAMRHHQRYFPVVGDDGRLLDGFIGIRDGDPSYHLDTVRQGNEWVLEARLRDAEFFFLQDAKIPLRDRVSSLEGVRFLRDSGSMLDKTNRISRLASSIAAKLGFSSETILLAEEAALLAKTDLVTQIVREFPELEGVMGGVYGELQGLDSNVTAALRDQYLPRGAKDKLPRPGVPAVVALSDKLDTLAAAFVIGLGVTGSADPYGLRRHALGVVGILISHGYDLDIEDLVSAAVSLSSATASEDVGSARANLVSFLMGRAEAVLLEQGLRIEVVRAILGGREKRLSRLPAMAEALSDAVNAGTLTGVVTGWRRSAVLAKGIEDGEVDEGLLKEEPEKALYKAISDAGVPLDDAFGAGDYSRYLCLLAELREAIDECLDRVLIMSEDPEVRYNRQLLLSKVARLFARFGDLSHVLPLI